MDQPAPGRVGRAPVPYRIVVKGAVRDQPVGALENFTGTSDGAETILMGTVVDQSQLQGVLQQLGEIGVEILSVAAVSDPDGG